MDYSATPNAPPMSSSDEKMPPPTSPHNPMFAPQPGMGYPTQPQGYGPAPPPYGSEGCPVAYGQGQYPMHPTGQVIVLQQGTAPLAEPLNNHFCYSIFTMMCCFMPVGIAALIYSLSTREANMSGNQMAAERSSRMSRTLNHVALGIGLGQLVLLIVCFIVIMGTDLD